MENSPDPAVESHFRAANRINRDTGRIRRILDREPHLEIHGDIAEEPALHADKANLVVVLPRNVVAGANMDVVGLHAGGGHGLNGFGLGLFLARESIVVEHIEKIRVSAGIELIGPLQLDTPFRKQIGQGSVGNRGPELGLDVVSHDGEALGFESRGKFRIAHNEYRNAVHEADARLKSAFGVETRGLF